MDHPPATEPFDEKANFIADPRGQPLPYCQSRRRWVRVTLATLIVVAGAWLRFRSTPPATRIERLSASAEEYFATDASIERIATGFEFAEGPLWCKDPGGTAGLLISDIPANVIYRWTPDAGLSVWMRRSGGEGVTAAGPRPGSNGLAVGPDGRLYLCEHGNRRVSAVNADGTRQTIADRFEGRRLNSPNDLVFDGHGNLFFTDPIYGLAGGAADPDRELNFCGVFCVDPAGRVSLLTDHVTMPNGIGLSPDGQTLYVSQSSRSSAIWTAMTVRREGERVVGADNLCVIADATDQVATAWGLIGPAGVPDGLAVDSAGTIFASGPGGVWVMTNQGKQIACLHLPGTTSNCCLDVDEHNLYITTADSLYRVPLRGR